jgi:two-component system response regulator HydG
LKDHERDLILKALEETKWNKHQAAKKLKITRSTLYGKMKKYGLTKE